MTVRPHKRYREFLARVSRLPKLVPWKEITFRSVDLDHASPDQILTGEGSLKFGSRWNAPGVFPVVYSSTRPGTAREEAFLLAADYRLKPDDLKPRIICGIEWHLSSVLNLTSADLPAWLNLPEWMHENFESINDSGFETLCQAFGRAARNSGVVALLCPSARLAKGVNLVVFRDRLRKADRMRLLGRAELEKHLA